jgi:hypothetical protein
LLGAQDTAELGLLAAEDRRFAAMVQADTTTLRTMLAGDLAYTHTSGAKQDRAGLLRSLASGELRYRSIAPTERTVRFLGSEGAVVVGRSDMQVESSGQVRAFSIRYVAVYQRVAGGWHLVAWQSTRLPN